MAAACLQGWSPLMSAASAGHEDVVKLLLSLGADLQMANNQGRTSLHYAVRGRTCLMTGDAAWGVSRTRSKCWLELTSCLHPCPIPCAAEIPGVACLAQRTERHAEVRRARLRKLVLLCAAGKQREANYGETSATKWGKRRPERLHGCHSAPQVRILLRYITCIT